MRLFRNILAAAALVLGTAAPAAAATIIGGGTAVTLTAAPALTGLGLSFAPFGSASLSNDPSGLPVVTFLITGGTITDDDEALIEHNGSGLRFSAGADVLDIGDFLIDSEAGAIFGFARANGTLLGTVALFTFDDDALVLELSAQAAAAFTSVFGAPDLTGLEIGFADPNIVVGGVAPIPEPQVWAMMVGGFLLVGGAARRRTARAMLA